MYQVTPIPAFSDNYIWAASKPNSPKIAVVDPGDAHTVIEYLEQNNLSLAAILVTHHHNDHTGGINELVERFSVPVYGPSNSPFTGISNPVSAGDTVELFGETLTVQEIPGHTLDHISYFTEQLKPQLFCGDTLFLAGCGRIFEGNAEQMLTAMKYFHTLPGETEVYCTHEYSMANLKFAQAVEPENLAIEQSITDCSELREADKPTLPTSIEQERQINPFMRTLEPQVKASAEGFSGTELHSEVEVFAAIREWKNQF